MRAFLQFISLAIAVFFIASAFIMKPTVSDPHSPAIFGVAGVLALIAAGVFDISDCLAHMHMQRWKMSRHEQDHHE
ncbi:TPA: hypothetical protein EYN98_13605 [Candidatus Poribacteria bacterium]|nr:hypothetical protein [Candidatus Poribacteria bacterium]HIA67067.1 hypothetical protein [Candidatus Poribacteria bacterium]HIB88322.1 hypothetical protein [Candidatus Poribacteria bacterium]HIN38678.1 hypothetical protein [Flavobacteriales bacterium]